MLTNRTLLILSSLLLPIACGPETTSNAAGGTSAGGAGIGGTSTGGTSTGGTSTGGTSTGGTSTGGAGTGGTSTGGAGTGGTSTGGAQTDLPDEDAVAVATVAMNSCGTDDGYFRVQEAMRGTRGHFRYWPGLVECLANVTTGCDGLYDCFGPVVDLPPERCNSCDGDASIVCGPEGEIRTLDCAAVGWTCIEGAGGCKPPGTEPCDSASSPPSCENGRPTECGGGSTEYLELGPACAPLGLQCEEGGGVFGMGPTCAGSGAECLLPDSNHGAYWYWSVAYEGTSCSGNILNGCMGGAEGSIDCRHLGENFSCQEFNGNFFCGNASECDYGNHVKTCTDGVVEFCSAGKLASVACPSLGFTQCGARAGYSDQKQGCE